MLNFLISESCAKPKTLVFFLHGYGSNSEDLLSLSQYFEDTVPDPLFISVNAPFDCEIANPFSNGYQWFSIQHPDKNEIMQQVMESYQILADFIKTQLEKYNLNFNDVVLIGFSQGTMMALHYALNVGSKIKAVIGFSGKLLTNKTNISSENICENIALIHGDADPVVPFSELEEAKKGLFEVGIKPKTFTCYDLVHSIDEKGINFARNFLLDLEEQDYKNINVNVI